MLEIDDSVVPPRLQVPRHLVESSAASEQASAGSSPGVRNLLIPIVLGGMGLAFAGLWLVRFRAAGGARLSLALGMVGVVALAGLVWASAPVAPSEPPPPATRVPPRTLPATPPLLTRPLSTRPATVPATPPRTRPVPTRPPGTKLPATPVKPIDDEVRKRLPSIPLAEQAVVEIVEAGDAIKLIVNRRHLGQLAEMEQ